MKIVGVSVCGVLLLSGCATTSFSPPSVNLENETKVVGSNFTLGQRCQPTPRKQEVTVAGKTEQINIPIEKTAYGAQRLIDNFIYHYRCRAHSAANGRQAFEVPALLTGIGTAAAAAFGAGRDVAVGGGTATAILSGGKSYYAPQEKANIYDSSLDALLCIKSEASGVDPITIEKIGSLEETKRVAPLVAGRSPATTTSEQYYELIVTSLLSVERVLAQRLSVVGTFDPAGVIAEIKALDKEVEENTDAAETDSDNQADALTAIPPGAAAVTSARIAAIVPRSERVAANSKISKAIVGLAAMQPKLQQCVIRAKI